MQAGDIWSGRKPAGTKLTCWNVLNKFEPTQLVAIQHCAHVAVVLLVRQRNRSSVLSNCGLEVSLLFPHPSSLQEAAKLLNKTFLPYLRVPHGHPLFEVGAVPCLSVIKIWTKSVNTLVQPTQLPAEIPWDLQALNWSSKQTYRQGASPWIQAPRTDLPWFVLAGFGIPRSQREGKKQAACPKAEEGERCSCFCPCGKAQREQVGWKWEYVLQVM